MLGGVDFLGQTVGANGMRKLPMKRGQRAWGEGRSDVGMEIHHIQRFVRQGKYRIKSHAVMHMFKEGFDEADCITALLNGRILEKYPEVKRCLVLGAFQLTPKTECPLHIVCDLSQPDRLEIVTAYIPQSPDWITPTRRGRRKR